MLRLAVSKLGGRNCLNAKLLHSSMGLIGLPTQFGGIKMRTYSCLPLSSSKSSFNGSSRLVRLGEAAFCSVGERDKRLPTAEMAASSPSKNKEHELKCCNESPTVGKIEPNEYETKDTGTKAKASTVADHQINLPNRDQVEKYFFRIIAFIYDLTYIIMSWAAKNIDQHIVQNETVQLYWKKLHEKMDKAKRD